MRVAAEQRADHVEGHLHHRENVWAVRRAIGQSQEPCHQPCGDQKRNCDPLHAELRNQLTFHSRDLPFAYWRRAIPYAIHFLYAVCSPYRPDLATANPHQRVKGSVFDSVSCALPPARGRLTGRCSVLENRQWAFDARQ